jgi:hypothetical protein
VRRRAEFAAAKTPATLPVTPPPHTRRVSRNAIASASNDPALATAIQIAGGRPESTSDSGDASVVTSTGSGFQDGPPVVSSSR